MTHPSVSPQAVNQWDLRHEVFTAAHQWPIILFMILAGGLAGWGFSIVIPTPYRAETSLHVSYNADTIYRNPDDFKNWQMEELEVLIYSDPLLMDVQKQLQEKDSFWNNQTIDGLRSSLKVYWRNVGTWRLVAQQSSPERAAQLVQAWENAILGNVSTATAHAETAYEIFVNFQVAKRTQNELTLRITELKQVKSALESWCSSADPQGDSQSISPHQNWQLRSLVARTAPFNAEGMSVLNQAPSIKSPIKDYLDWVDQAITFIDVELPILQQQLSDFAAKSELLYPQWLEESTAARGVTAYLVIDPIPQSSGNPQQVRTTPTAVLIGGILGLIIWGIVWLAVPTIKSARLS
jgi:hypothetical protein